MVWTLSTYVFLFRSQASSRHHLITTTTISSPIRQPEATSLLTMQTFFPTDSIGPLHQTSIRIGNPALIRTSSSNSGRVRIRISTRLHSDRGRKPSDKQISIQIPRQTSILSDKTKIVFRTSSRSARLAPAPSPPPARAPPALLLSYQMQIPSDQTKTAFETENRTEIIKTSPANKTPLR